MVILALGILGDFALIVTVLREELVQLCQESGVADHPRSQALLIQHGQDASLTLGHGNKIHVSLTLSSQPSHPHQAGGRESGRQGREDAQEAWKGGSQS